MPQLSTEAFTRAEGFVLTRARELDRCRYEYAFRDGSPQAVMNAVAAYRNDDGGFGCALEPDCRYDGSWPVATCVALAILHEVGVPGDEPLVLGAAEYLVKTFDTTHDMWPFSLPGMNEVPHGPWWHNNGDPDEHDGFALVNPLFAAVGCLYRYVGAAPAEFLAHATAVAMARLADQPDAMEKHILRDALFMLPALPEPECHTALEQLRRVVPATVECDPAEWNTYCAAPLWVAPTPTGPVADLVADDLDAHLDFEVARQAGDGSWPPTWTWMGHYDDVWPVAQQEWAGALTVEMLKCLRAHARIEGF